MGFDLGERSRLAYWVNREYYPEPSRGNCGTGDLITSEDLAAVDATGARALAQRVDAAAEVDALTTDPKARATLIAIANRLEGPPPDNVEREIRGLDVQARVSPFPKPVRQWLTRRLTAALLRDVHDLFYVEKRRTVMRNSLIERIDAGGGPFVVIGHSQGSMIAYVVLCELARTRPDLEIPLFVTIGSPLGIKEVQDEIKRLTKQARLAVPGCVKRWLNVADLLDPVAFDKWLEGDFAATNGVRVDDNIEWNPDSPRHPHSGTGYLQTKPVRRAVRDVVETGIFQPVARFVIARDVVKELENSQPGFRHRVLIELADPAEQRAIPLEDARRQVTQKILELSGLTEDSGLLRLEPLQRFVAADLTRQETERLATSLAELGVPGKPVARVWRNSAKRALLDRSIHTVQAYPAHSAYQALGDKINWAVLDSGIAAGHPHFNNHGSIKAQFDCTKQGPPKDSAAPDKFGHGTHVAGIIAGSHKPTGTTAKLLSGIAPRAGLYIYKVLDDHGMGDDASIIKALDHIGSTNEQAGQLVVHGVNLSLGGGFDQSAYACGHSPLCRELKRLWRQGVLVVIAAGNEGFVVLEATHGPVDANMDLSIGDPANLEEAIAVGSIHKSNPHSYGVSYFSSRGPTADGRQKPDCVAPGERIVSCRHDIKPTSADEKQLYVEMSGTSMAAPHVSGVLAAFLSMRREFIGEPETVKRILLENCTDLGRDRPMQGAGMPNLVKMLMAT